MLSESPERCEFRRNWHCRRAGQDPVVLQGAQRMGGGVGEAAVERGRLQSRDEIVAGGDEFLGRVESAGLRGLRGGNRRRRPSINRAASGWRWCPAGGFPARGCPQRDPEPPATWGRDVGAAPDPRLPNGNASPASRPSGAASGHMIRIPNPFTSVMEDGDGRRDVDAARCVRPSRSAPVQSLKLVVKAMSRGRAMMAIVATIRLKITCASATRRAGAVRADRGR